MAVLLRSSAMLLVAVGLLAPTVYGLQCYSCSTDDSDLDCDNPTVLEKITCQPFSVDHPVQPVCGYQRLIASSNDVTERIWRGCAVGGECDLLSRQGSAAFNTIYRMSVCEECTEDDCNGKRNGGTIVNAGYAVWFGAIILIVPQIVYGRN